MSKNDKRRKWLIKIIASSKDLKVQLLAVKQLRKLREV